MPALKVTFVGVGNIGSVILEGLVGLPQFDITVVTRSDPSTKGIQGVKVVQSDMSPEHLRRVFTGQDVVISVVGATAFDQQTKMVDAAIAAGVKRFFPSEFSFSSLDETVVEFLPVIGIKTVLIDYLKSKQSPTFSWTAIASSGLIDWGLSNGLMGFDIKNRTANIWDDGNTEYSMTTRKDICTAVATALEKPGETKNQFMFIGSVETSHNELLKSFEEETGATWTVTTTTTDEEIAKGRENLAKGEEFAGTLQLAMAVVYGNMEKLRNNYFRDEVLSNETLGVTQKTTRDIVLSVLN